MAQKSLVLHLGPHQTGAELIRQWLQDHADILSPHLRVYGPGPEGTDPLREAAVALSRGRPGAAEQLTEAARDLADRMRAEDAPLLCISDETLLGLPLGQIAPAYVETEIYPGLCPIIDILAQAFAEFDPVFVTFYRGPDAWLRNLHAMMVRNGAFEGDLESYLELFAPVVHWPDLHDEMRFALQGRGQLDLWRFEVEFRHDTVSEMGFFQRLDLPAEVLAQCRPGLHPATPDPQSRPQSQHQSQPRPAATATIAPPAALPRALVLGGPNGLLPGSWARLLHSDYAALIDVRNMSMGACTSALALYRMLALEDPAPGAAVLWEQGITEYNHLAGGQTLDSLLYHVEWLLQLCIRDNRPFVPVLMQTRAQATLAGDSLYVLRIRALFASYGVAVVDCGRVLQVLARGPVTLEDWYSSNAMYDMETDFHRRLAETVLIALEGAQVPVAPPGRAAHFAGRTLRLRAPDETTDLFDSPSLRYNFAPFDPPIRIATPGRALAAIIATSGSGPVIRLSAKETGLGCYATQIPHGAGQPSLQLRQLVLGTGPHGLEIPGGVVQIDRDDSTTTPIVQTMYHQGDPPADPVPTGLVALLCEEPQDSAI